MPSAAVIWNGRGNGKMKIGILGGTFDPVHRGHLAIAGEVRNKLSLDTVLFMPAGQPWMKAGEDVTPAQHRVEMVWLAISGEPGFELSTLEIQRQGPTYTVDTLVELKDRLGEGVELFFIVGVGSLQELPLWHEPARLISLCTLVVVPRPGYSSPDVNALEARIPGLSRRLVLLDGPNIDISATAIRERIAQGLSIADLVTDSVAQYIEEHKLYIRV
jgi:nicotinate-nucleotide adenylyltransferase